MRDDPAPQSRTRPQRGFLLRAIRNLLRGVGRRNDDSWREALEELIEEEETGRARVAPDERAILANLLEFGELRVRDVMRPRADIVAVEAKATLKEVLAEVRAKGHSRMPVYRKSLDDILGLVHLRDLMSAMETPRPFVLAEIVRPALFVAPSMRVIDLLTRMRDARLHMAIVVDEYGGTDGLVTIEDIVEEIVGEIEDEHEAGQPPAIVAAPDGALIADARSAVEDLELMLGQTVARPGLAEDVDTLGGLVFSLAGRVPARGELITHPDGLEFEVLEAEPRRIKRLRIRRLARGAASPAASRCGSPSRRSSALPPRRRCLPSMLCRCTPWALPASWSCWGTRAARWALLRSAGPSGLATTWPGSIGWARVSSSTRSATAGPRCRRWWASRLGSDCSPRARRSSHTCRERAGLAGLWSWPASTRWPSGLGATCSPAFPGIFRARSGASRGP
jgi:Mg2+/Co2+ transporter CorC